MYVRIWNIQHLCTIYLISTQFNMITKSKIKWCEGIICLTPISLCLNKTVNIFLSPLFKQRYNQKVLNINNDWKSQFALNLKILLVCNVFLFFILFDNSGLKTHTHSSVLFIELCAFWATLLLVACWSLSLKSYTAYI